MNLLVNNLDIDRLDFLLENGFNVSFHDFVFIYYEEDQYHIKYEEYYNPHASPKRFYKTIKSSNLNDFISLVRSFQQENIF